MAGGGLKTRQKRRRNQTSDPLTEGERLLREVPASLREIAEEIGVAHKQVSVWRNGKATPGPAARAALRDSYEIPVTAWAQSPGGGGAAAAPKPAPKRGRQEGPTLAEVVAELDYLHELRDDGDLLPAEKVRLSDSISKNLALKARLERDQELLDDRIAREHPTVIRATKALLAVVDDHPEIGPKLEAALASLVGE